ncbi:hypothetical protein J6590_007843 [Homalodisca vitripennis]|nr:hypothetical protein J6590_007843 [Homalodisca vitripennis]
MAYENYQWWVGAVPGLLSDEYLIDEGLSRGCMIPEVCNDREDKFPSRLQNGQTGRLSHAAPIAPRAASDNGISQLRALIGLERLSHAAPIAPRAASDNGISQLRALIGLEVTEEVIGLNWSCLNTLITCFSTDSDDDEGPTDLSAESEVFDSDKDPDFRPSDEDKRIYQSSRLFQLKYQRQLEPGQIDGSSAGAVEYESDEYSETTTKKVRKKKPTMKKTRKVESRKR